METCWRWYTVWEVKPWTRLRTISEFGLVTLQFVQIQAPVEISFEQSLR